MSHTRTRTSSKSSPAVWNARGLSLAAQGRLDDAIFAYIRALTADPLFARARDNLGIALAAQGRVDEAIRAHAAAIEDDPAYGEGHLHHAAALASAGRFLEAVDAYHRAMEVDPEIARTAEVRTNLQLVLARIPAQL